MEPNNPVAAAISPGMKRSRAEDDHQHHSSNHHHHRNSGRGGGRGRGGRGRGDARQSHFLDRTHDGSRRPSRRRGRESGFHKPYPHTTNSNSNSNNNGANTINTIIKPCSVCQAPQAKYKCPQCRALYCSVACCRQHKQQQPEMCHKPQLSPAPLPVLSKKKDEADDDDNNNDEEEGQVLESADTVTTNGTTLLPSPSLPSRCSRYIPNFDTYLIQQHEPFWDRSMDDHDRNDGSSVTSVHVNRHHSTEAFDRVDANSHDNHSRGQNNNNNDDDDDDDDWKITADMKIAMHGSAWLRDELDRDPGLRYLIEQIATAPANRNDSGIRNHHHHHQKQERRGPFQMDKTATRTKATAPAMRQEELLDRMQCDFPQFQFFIDQLLVVTGVLDHVGDSAQNTIPPSPPPPPPPPLLRFTSKTTTTTATTKAMAAPQVHRSEYMEQQTTTQTTRPLSIEASKIDQNEEEHSSRLFDLNSLDSTSRSSRSSGSGSSSSTIKDNGNVDNDKNCNEAIIHRSRRTKN